MNTDSTLNAFLPTPDAEKYVCVDEETLIEDRRGTVRPAQCVEQKLVAALQTGPVFLSQVQHFKRPHDR
jgi:hypothetical protein